MKVKDDRFQACGDEVCVEPKEWFKITCGVCFRNRILEYMKEGKPPTVAVAIVCEDLGRDEFDMFLRQSSLGRNTNISNRAFANNLFYKCLTCDSQKLFGVPISEDYYVELYKRRGDRNVFTPIDKWMEDEKKRRLLKALGYI
jgi:hypothetical protein